MKTVTKFLLFLVYYVVRNSANCYFENGYSQRACVVPGGKRSLQILEVELIINNLNGLKSGL